MRRQVREPNATVRSPPKSRFKSDGNVPIVSLFYGPLFMVDQQQHSSQVQFEQSFAEGLVLHSDGRQPQSAHLT
jgi:hypothetical protein